MLLRNKLNSLVLMIGDILIFYFSLFLAIFVRFGYPFQQSIFREMLTPFTFVLLSWFIPFGISHLYELKFAENKRRFWETILKLFIATIILSVLVFYFFIPALTPKTILFLLLLFFWLIFSLWRIFFNYLIKIPHQNILLISQAKEKEELKDFLQTHPQLGYRVKRILTSLESDLEDIIKEEAISLVVVDKRFLAGLLKDYPSLPGKARIIDFLEFSANVMGKIPLSSLDDSWFLGIQQEERVVYRGLKRVVDFGGAIILFAISLPLWPLIALAIKINSPGPVIYKSIRKGKKGREFYIYKFRTMIKKASKIGPAWTVAHDKRITKVGKFLRWSHLDEVPQVINILKGDLSFVGPRPEEKKLVELFLKEIPFYNYRFLMKPGVIGWAQINYSHGSSIEDTREKLRYDFYYLKNRNLFFDFLIALKAWRIPFEIKTH